MKILGVENVLAIKDGKKKYKRIARLQSNGTELIEWKFDKSNHTLKDSQQKELEERYKENVTHIFSKESGKRKSAIFLNPLERNLIDKEVKKHLKFGSKLSAVKYVKEATGLGLREAKDYVDDYVSKKNIKRKI